MKRVLFTLCVLGGVPQIAGADIFAPSRDTFIDGFQDSNSTERNYGSGKEPNDRFAKTTQESYVIDFSPTAIQAYKTANPLGPDQAYNAVLFLKPRDGFSTTPLSVSFGALNLSQDWIEGDGTGTANFNWTANTKDATDNFAQHQWKFDTDGITKITDTANSVKWTGADANLTEYATYFDVPLGIMNSQPFTASSADHNLYVGVKLDDALLDDVLNNPNNRGLAFRNLTNSGNQRIYGREDSTGRQPYLEITVVAVPEPASMSALAIGGLMALRRRRQA